MTNSELAQSLASELGEAYHDPDIADRFDAWVKDGIEEVVAAEEWPFARVSVGLNLTTNEPVYDLSALLGSVLAISKPGDGRPLHYTTAQALVIEGHDLTQTGTPSHWMYAGVDESDGTLTVRVWPIPVVDESFVVFGERRPFTETTPEDTFPLPGDFVQAVKSCVRASHYTNISNVEMARFHDAKYKQAVAILKRRYAHVAAHRVQFQTSDLPPAGRFAVPTIPYPLS